MYGVRPLLLKSIWSRAGYPRTVVNGVFLLAIAAVIVSGCNTQQPYVPVDEAGTKTDSSKLPADDDLVVKHSSPDAAAEEELLASDTSTPSSNAAPAATRGSTKPLPTNAVELARARNELDKSVWAKETLAQEHEQTFVRLWDDLLKAKDKYAPLAAFPLREVIVGTKPSVKQLDWGIESTTYEGATKTYSSTEWRRALSAMQSAGYQIVETEWHHLTFEPGKGTSPAHSVISYLLHVENQGKHTRYIVRGKLKVAWATEPELKNKRLAQAGSIDATEVTILSRSGPAAFDSAVLTEYKTDSSGVEDPSTIHPVILHDLDDDGLAELIVGGANEVWWNRGNWKFERAQLCKTPPGHSNCGVVADFTGDGIADYLVGIKSGFPLLYRGQAGGKFPELPQTIKSVGQAQPSPTGITAADIDGDGDLEVFIGQQKPGYQTGDIPTPYFDCNDSFPSVLLVNDGRGNFHDGTEAAGLAAKRNRRNFASSFVDLDDDGDLDLLLTSDFAGSDLLLNDGKGHFTDATKRIQPRPFAFGMSHTFGDYDRDGRLDFMIIGMSSTTARRLEQMKLRREEFPEYNDRRMDMGYGNRLYLNRGDAFEQAPFNASVARTGWSWASTTLDFDNDGDQDVYVVNGQISGATTRDYCTRFWCHDIYYKTEDRPDAAISEFFQKMAPLFNGHMLSWNGYEHNALLMNLGGKDFVNVGFLMGVGFEFDSRAAVSGDLDGDGRVDLVVEEKDHRGQLSRLYLVRNNWQGPEHWIGVHLRQQAPGTSPLGAKVAVELDDGRRLVQHNISGHSVWVQHPNTVHFGLGDQSSVKSLTVTWPDGRTSRLENPAVDRYHVVAVPSGG